MRAILGARSYSTGMVAAVRTPLFAPEVVPLHGSTTLKAEVAARGAEPDLIGRALRGFPEIAIEVVHSTPLLDKCKVYAPMAVTEVWVCEAAVRAPSSAPQT